MIFHQLPLTLLLKPLNELYYACLLCYHYASIIAYLYYAKYYAGIIDSLTHDLYGVSQCIMIFTAHAVIAFWGCLYITKVSYWASISSVQHYDHW